MRINRPTVAVEAWTVPAVAWLENLGQGEARIKLDTPAWTTWLDGPGVSFAYPVYDPRHGYIDGFMTVRKERRQRGGNYWTVYRRDSGRVRKVYIGRAAAVTHARLAAIARTFLPREDSRRGAATSPLSFY